MEEKWIGRIDNETKKVQGLKEHLNNVGGYSAEFASKIGLEKVGRLIGFLHDMGKASNEFRDYILKVIENPKLFSSEKIDHSTASSKYLYERYNPKSLDEKSQYKKILLEIITVSMMGHHGGLINFVDRNAESPYINRIKKKLINYDEVKNNFLMDIYSETQIDKLFEESVDELYKFINGSIKPFEIGMTIKFLHSCLIDADRLDAFRFSNEVKYYSQKADFLVYKASLEKYISKFKSKSKIDDMRSRISNQCAAAGKKGIGNYTLTIPTGGGKTLSSVRFALEHAVENNLDRIIYIVPYLSIIEQNAEVIKKALGLDDELLEFHSNIINNEVNDDVGEGYFQQLILSERFDKPIIFTSMIQFLEIFYDKKNSKRRRLNNLANSVIIYDECQAVPIHCTKLFIKAIDYLSKFCSSTGLLMTATQPGFENIEGINFENNKIIDNIDEMYKVFKRVSIIDYTDKIYQNRVEISGFVIERLNQVDNLLFICNTKSSAKAIYTELMDMCPNAKIVYLSTNLCAAHRKDILSDIKKCLKESNEGGKKLICITTQLIEAGVDISFQEVIRSLAGLDSVVQAAGRCNRNGEVELANVFLVNLGFENLSRLTTIKSGRDATLKVIDDIKKGIGKLDLLAEENISKYFKYYYKDNNEYLDIELDESITMVNILGANKFYGDSYNKNHKNDILMCKQPFKYAEEIFYVIENCGRSVIVPYGGGEEIIAELISGQDIYQKKSILSKGQVFTINLFEHEWRTLDNNDGIAKTGVEGVFVLKSRFYDKDYGLDIDGFARVDTEEYQFDY